MTENDLILQNTGLVKKILTKFKPRGQDEYEEMLQIGRIALLQAIRHHDASRGKLSTLAWYAITNEFIRYRKNQNKNCNTISANKPCFVDYDKFDQFNYSCLSDRQKQILDLKAQGYKLSEISRILKLSRSKVVLAYNLAIKLIRAENA